nr:Na+/H+ antiporter NhaA [Micromonospora sp. DSM 115978]
MAMSTDTAFVVGVLALFGPRCPDRLRLFILTLAIVDDIGAISIIAIFYTDEVNLAGLAVAAATIVVLFGLRWMGVWQLTPYVLAALVLWGAVYASGVHGTLAGVIVGLLVPSVPPSPERARDVPIYVRALQEDSNAARSQLAVSAARATVAPSERLQYVLHPI